MAIREDLVASAIKCMFSLLVSWLLECHQPLSDVHAVRLTDHASTVLQDPNVAASPVEKRIAFLQAKNLTQEEITAALARAGPEASPAPSYAAPTASSVAAQPPPYYPQYPPQYPQYAWQQPPSEPPRRDWRDWFIMATVVGGVSYGIYNLGKVSRMLLSPIPSPVIPVAES